MLKKPGNRMKILPSLVASSLFIALCAENPQMTPPVGCSSPYFLDCRSVMGEVYGDLLFLQPNGSSLYYAAEAIPLDQSINGGSGLQAVSPNWKVFEIFPNYSAAFKIGTKMLFSDLKTNLEANWERVYSSKSASKSLSTTADGGVLMIGPFFDIGPNSTVYTNAHGKAHFHFDSVDLVFGQEFCSFARLYPNLFAGGSFARIHQSLQSTYSNASGASDRTVKTYSTFTGAGPQFGLNFDYRIVAGFFFTGSSSLGLIIGELQNGTTYESDSPFLTSHGVAEPNTQTTEVPNRTQLIPAFKEKLGFSYASVFSCCKVEFGFGYQTEIYIDAIQSVDMTAPQVVPTVSPVITPDAGVYAVGFERTLSNFILTGPYISLSIDF